MITVPMASVVPAPTVTGESALTGTVELVRLALRRDRVVLPLWIATSVAVAAGSAAATLALYPDAQSIGQTNALINSTPSLLALYGPLHDVTSVAELAMWKPAGSGALLVAVLTLLTVVRHTRAEEESGRLELLGSTALGRGAALAAALAVGTGTALVLGLLTAVALVLTGLPVAGCVAFGAGWAGIGAVFAGVGAVAAQLTRSARRARILAMAALVVAFLLRAAGDATGPEALSWVSPLGWMHQLRAFAEERWWVLLLPVALTIVLTALAHRLSTSRDHGAGLLPDRSGPAVAGTGLRGTWTLALRLQRGVQAVWVVAFALMGAVLGNIASGVDGLLDSAQLRDVVTALGGRQGLTDAFLATDLALMGMIASVYAVQSVLRLHTEEEAGRADVLLSGPVGRMRWAASHLLVALAGTVLLMVVAGAATGLTHGLNTGDVGHQVLRLVGASLAPLPAVWVVGGSALALWGIAPSFAGASWFVVVGTLLIAEIGPVVRLPQWIMNSSPFVHVPHLPGGAFSAWPSVWLSVVAVGLIAVGLAAVRRRDIT